jgi:MerR family redox-sensitive transcriptional activator SoxR
MVEVKTVEVKAVASKAPELKRFSVGELAAAGVATSALRFYEEHGLIHAERNVSGHRRYRSTLRRVAFIRVAQRIGLSLGEIAALGSLPPNARRRATTGTSCLHDGCRGSTSRSPRWSCCDRLDGCIGCGCLSLETCELYNTNDRAARRGAGARYLIGDPIETGPADG